MAKTTTKKSTPRPAEMTDRFEVRPVSQIQSHRSWCFYGRAGTGKTTLAGTFPGPILLLNVRDFGTDSVADHENMDVRDVETWEDFEITYWWLKKNPKKYKTVVIDTVTQLQQIAVEKVLEDNNKESEKAGEWGVMTKREWGQAASLMKLWCTNFRDLPMEVVFLAQDRTTESETEDPETMLDPEVGPRLMPSLAAHLTSEVSVVGNTFIRQKIAVRKDDKGRKKEVEKKQYCLRLGPSPVYVTKARKPKKIELPEVMVDPDYDQLISVLKGE